MGKNIEFDDTRIKEEEFHKYESYIYERYRY